VSAAAPSFGLYVHWPFCLSKCPYCDFNSHVGQIVDQTRWRDALLAELAHYAAAVPDRTVVSLFFGGGTPSLMAPATAAAVIDAVAGRWHVAEDIEITLEANPTSVEAARFRDLRSAGVNRLSVGVQALDNAALAFLGRGHDRAEAIAAVDIAARAFPRTSFDLIYGRPGQTVAAWESELAEALTLAGGHLSLYQLTIERGTPFFAAHRDGGFAVPDDDLAATLFEQTQAAMEAAGMPAYEISNHAAPGEESRHNLTYWRGGDYVGIGPGAHGRLTVDGAPVATEQAPAPETWLAAVEAKGHGTRRREALAPDQRARERVLTALRLSAGLDRSEFETLSGLPLDAVIDAAALARLVEAGYVESDSRVLRATAEGRLRLNAVIAALLG
jgi:oxygen-independent coproporphyrinogen-3 oxidase